MTEPIRFLDMHMHVQSSQFDADREAVLERAFRAGVQRLVEVGYDLPTSRAALALADEVAAVSAVVGVQPNHAHEAPTDWLEQVRILAGHPQVVAIGEIGLDYYRNYAAHALQHEVFRQQLALADELGLPVVIHTRDAWDDTIQVLRQYAAPNQRGMMHSFSGTWEHAAACLDLGFLLSFSGPVTFRKARELHEVAQRAPREAILTETDSPYLSPHPMRGKRNEPARVVLVAECLAELRGVSLATLTEAVWENAAGLFHW